MLNVDPGCQSLLTLPDAMNVLTTLGIAPLKDFPYKKDNCTEKPDERILQTAGRYFAAGFRRVNFLDDGEMKRLLVQGHPIIVALMVGDKFRHLSGNEAYVGTDEDELSLRPHALVVVGYDNKQQTFRVMNSWGSEWGDAGFAWISMPAFRRWAREAYVLYDAADDAGSAAKEATTLVQVVARAEVAIGTVTTTRSTDDNHCVTNCSGEPTRKNYQIYIDPAPDVQLRNAKLACIAGPCQGWNEVHYMQTESQGHRVVASWDTWGHPTTWKLSADQFKLGDVLRISNRIKPGQTFDVQIQTGSPAPRVETSDPNGTKFVFEAGTPIKGDLIQEVKRATTAQGETIITYKLLQK